MVDDNLRAEEGLKMGFGLSPGAKGPGKNPTAEDGAPAPLALRDGAVPTDAVGLQTVAPTALQEIPRREPDRLKPGYFYDK